MYVLALSACTLAMQESLESLDEGQQDEGGSSESRAGPRQPLHPLPSRASFADRLPPRPSELLKVCRPDTRSEMQNSIPSHADIALCRGACMNSLPGSASITVCLPLGPSMPLNVCQCHIWHSLCQTFLHAMLSKQALLFMEAYAAANLYQTMHAYVSHTCMCMTPRPTLSSVLHAEVLR